MTGLASRQTLLPLLTLCQPLLLPLPGPEKEEEGGAEEEVWRHRDTLAHLSPFFHTSYFSLPFPILQGEEEAGKGSGWQSWAPQVPPEATGSVGLRDVPSLGVGWMCHNES